MVCVVYVLGDGGCVCSLSPLVPGISFLALEAKCKCECVCWSMVCARCVCCVMVCVRCVCCVMVCAQCVCWSMVCARYVCWVMVCWVMAGVCVVYVLGEGGCACPLSPLVADICFLALEAKCKCEGMRERLVRAKSECRCECEVWNTFLPTRNSCSHILDL